MKLLDTTEAIMSHLSDSLDNLLDPLDDSGNWTLDGWRMFALGYFDALECRIRNESFVNAAEWSDAYTMGFDDGLDYGCRMGGEIVDGPDGCYVVLTVE